MAITILNEMSVAGALLSPYMRPVLYFSVSGAGAVTSPTAEIEYDGATEDVTIEAVFLRTVATVHYFSVDLTDVMRYLMKTFDGGSYPDDLEFINGNLLQKFDEYFRSLEVDIYFERGTVNAQTLSIAHYWLTLANQLPYASGFSLENVRTSACLQNLKWSKNTYNALFFWAPAGTLTITKGTVGGSGSYTADSTAVTADDSTTVDGGLTGTGETTIYTGTVTAGYYQYKFAKTSIYLDKGKNVITVTTAAGAKTITIDYDPDCASVFALCWQHPLLGYVSFPFNGNKVSSMTGGKRVELDKSFTTLVNINSLKEIMGYDPVSKAVLITKADEDYWPLLEYLYISRHVYLFIGADGANDTAGTWIECEVGGNGSYRSDRTRGTFTVELTLPEPFNVRL